MIMHVKHLAMSLTPRNTQSILIMILYQNFWSIGKEKIQVGVIQILILKHIPSPHIHTILIELSDFL